MGLAVKQQSSKYHLSGHLLCIYNVYICVANCSCLQEEGTRRTVCKGPSVSPCSCSVNPCQVTNYPHKTAKL